MKYPTRYKFAIILFATLLLITINGCSIRYVADYDAAVKQEVFRIAKKVDLFWGMLLDTPQSARQYQKFTDHYNQIETDIRGLVIQNQIRETNQETTKQAKIALDLWMQDRATHKSDDGFSDFVAKRHRKQYYRVFMAMAKGEKAKETANDKNP